MVTPDPVLPPNALDRWEEIASQLAGKRPAVFLDYDGTLTRIVNHPERATLSVGMRRTLRRLARSHPTAIVTGRARADIAALVGLPEIRYAGCHGFDMSSPLKPDALQELQQEMTPLLTRTADELRLRTASIPGVQVEDKGLAVALHFRRVPARSVPEVLRIGREVLARQPGLRHWAGNTVVDIVPALEWNKGHAVLRMLAEKAMDGPETVPLYIGDDATDEDALLALEGLGIGIVVARSPRPSAAGYSLNGVTQVRAFLSRLADFPAADVMVTTETHA